MHLVGFVCGRPGQGVPVPSPEISTGRRARLQSKTDMERDPKEPGTEGSVPTEALQRAHCTQKGLLRGVFRVFGIAEHLAAEGGEHPLVRVQEAVHRLGVSALCGQQPAFEFVVSVGHVVSHYADWQTEHTFTSRLCLTVWTARKKRITKKMSKSPAKEGKMCPVEDSQTMFEYYNTSSDFGDHNAAAFMEQVNADPDHWARPMITDLQAALGGKRVLEVACGYGRWTRLPPRQPRLFWRPIMRREILPSE